MISEKQFSLLLLLSSVGFVVPEPTCVLQGVCGKNANGIIPCSVSKDPHKFEDSSDVLKVLRDECPELVKGSTGIPDVCCSPFDVLQMQTFMGFVDKHLGSCPACARNMKELLCHLHCSPVQSKFLQVSKTTPSANGSAVDSLTYYVSKDSLSAMYQTCAGLPAIKAFVRVDGCEKDCDNPAQLAHVLGEKKIRSPFDMDVRLVDKGASLTVNGKPGAPAELLTQSCKDSNSCGPTCLA